MRKNNFLIILKNIFLSIILLIIFNSNKCDENTLKNKEDCHGKNINNYIQLRLSCNKDSVSFGDTLMYNLSFVNKTDSNIRFYPKTRMLVCKEPCAFGSLNKTFSKVFSDTVDMSKIVCIEPKESYSCQYKSLIKKEDLLFFEEGINEVFIVFYYDSTNQISDKSQILNIKKFMFCGFLKSNKIKIKIK